MGLNKYIDFSTAKLLKEKGFDEDTLHYYFEDGEFRQNLIRDTYGYYGEEYIVEYSELINNWNDNYTTKKNGDRCFGCDKSKEYFKTFSAPTIAESVMWLYKKHGIWIYCEITKDKFYTKAKKLKSNWRRVVSGIENNKIVTYNSPTEAYEAGIKYVLTNLI